jgi:hypothetical protein
MEVLRCGERCGYLEVLGAFIDSRECDRKDFPGAVGKIQQQTRCFLYFGVVCVCLRRDSDAGESSAGSSWSGEEVFVFYSATGKIDVLS